MSGFGFGGVRDLGFAVDWLWGRKGLFGLDRGTDVFI